MVDIEGLFETAKELVKDFYELNNAPDVSLSWGKKEDFETNDPFNMVKIRDDTLVINQEIRDDDSWFIDAVKGLVYYYLDGDLQNVHGWNFSTLISLIIIPTTTISDSKKSTYRRQWLDYPEYSDMLRYHYERWFKVLDAFSRSKISELLREFIEEEYNSQQHKSLESQFNIYLQTSLDSLFSEDEITMIDACLRCQSLDISTFEDQFPDYSRSKLYRIKSKLDLSINNYILPKFAELGLTTIYAFYKGHVGDTNVRSFPYFENIEAFANSDLKLLKFKPPITSINSLLNLSSIPGPKINRMFIQLPGQMLTKYTPLMFQPKSNNWRSVYQHEEEGITIQPSSSEQINLDALTPRDIKILKNMVRGRTTRYRKLSTDYSQSKTKSSISKLTDNDAYSNRILWRRPADMTTAGILVSLGNVTREEIDNEFLEGQFELKQVILDHQILKQIFELSWPYINIEYGININEKHNGLELTKMAYLKIAGDDTDLLQLIATSDNLENLGLFRFPPGTNVVLPEQEFDDGEWQFELEDFFRSMSIEDE